MFAEHPCWQRARIHIGLPSTGALRVDYKVDSRHHINCFRFEIADAQCSPFLPRSRLQSNQLIVVSNVNCCVWGILLQTWNLWVLFASYVTSTRNNWTNALIIWCSICVFVAEHFNCKSSNWKHWSYHCIIQWKANCDNVKFNANIFQLISAKSCPMTPLQIRGGWATLRHCNNVEEMFCEIAMFHHIAYYV